MNTRSRFFVSSALGAIAIHVLFVACSSPSSPSSATDSGVIGLIRDVMNIEVPDANAQTDGGACSCPPGPAGPAGPAGPGSTVYRAAQDPMMPATSTNGWVDVSLDSPPSFTTTGMSNIDIQAVGVMTATGNPGSTGCAVRFTLDGAPVGGPDGVLALNVLSAGALVPWTSLYSWTGIGAGSHSIRLQILKLSPGAANCINGSSRLLVTVR